MNGNNEIQAVDITRTREDFAALSRHASKHNSSAPLYFIISMVVVSLLCLTLLNLVLRHNFWGFPKLESAITAIVLIFLVMFSTLKILSKILTPRMYHDYLNDNQNFLRKKRITIDEKGFRETSDVGEGYTMWQGVDHIERTDTLMLVYIDKIQAFVVPIHSFSTPEQANQFYENMLAYWHKARELSVPVRTE